MPSHERAAAGARYSRNSLWDRVLKCQFAEMSDYGMSGQKMRPDQSPRDLIAQRSLSLFAAKSRAALGDEGSYSFPRIIGAAGRDDGLLSNDCRSIRRMAPKARVGPEASVAARVEASVSTASLARRDTKPNSSASCAFSRRLSRKEFFRASYPHHARQKPGVCRRRPSDRARHNPAQTARHRPQRQCQQRRADPVRRRQHRRDHWHIDAG